MKLRIIPVLLSLCLLTGCTAMLERTYTTSEPHSSKFWESEAAGTLRAENHQDIVNDLLLLVSQHTETATLRLYNFKDEMKVTDTLERATTEILQETPMGAYAVEYITSSVQAQRGYYEVAVQISYRRTAEQVQAVVNATSTEAVYNLLETALDEEKTELAVRIGYWSANGYERVESAMTQLREDRGLTEGKPWLVYYYPADGPVGLVEFLLDPSEELLAEELPAEPTAPESTEDIEENTEASAEEGAGEAPPDAKSGENAVDGSQGTEAQEAPDEELQKEN